MIYIGNRETAIQVDIHPPPSCCSTVNGPSGSSNSNRIESNGGDSDLYELIPSEKEFGTLGNARPVLRGVSHPILKILSSVSSGIELHSTWSPKENVVKRETFDVSVRRICCKKKGAKFKYAEPFSITFTVQVAPGGSCCLR